MSLPLDKEAHARAIIFDASIARQMALAGLAAIQTWETIEALKEAGPVSQPAQAQQLSLI